MTERFSRKMVDPLRMAIRSIAAGSCVTVVLGCGSPTAREPQTAPSTHVEEPRGGDAEATWQGEEPSPQQSGGTGPCKSELIGPAIIGDADYAARIGVAATRFSELRTSMAAPLEECGLKAVLRRLATLTCDDGANPFQGDLRVAHASRRGSYGPGGRCRKIIDLYEVRCSHGMIEVHADMYICSKETASNWL